MDEQQKQRWRNLGQKIKGIAPGIAALLGGPAVGAGAKILLDHFGAKNDREVAVAIEGLNHEGLLDLKRIDAETTWKELEVEQSIHADFTKRTIAEYETGNRWLWLIRPGLSIFWTGLTAWIVLFSIHGTIPVGKELIVDSAFRFCATIEIAIIGFWFGSRGFEKVAKILTDAKEKPLIGKVVDIFRKRREQQHKEAA